MTDEQKQEAELWTRQQFEAHWNGGDIMDAVMGGRLSIECHENELPNWDNPHECHGWKMSSIDWLADEIELYGATQAEADAATKHRNQLLDRYDTGGRHNGSAP